MKCFNYDNCKTILESDDWAYADYTMIQKGRVFCREHWHYYSISTGAIDQGDRVKNLKKLPMYEDK